jgi:hypothetical protein
MSLFPEFEKFVSESGLFAKAKGGALAANLPRILGQGKTKSIGLDLPPAPIERKLEIINLKLPDSVSLPQVVKDEIETVRVAVEREIKELTSEEGSRRLCSQAIQRIRDATGVNAGIKDNFFFADRLVLVPEMRRQSWSWNITPHYPVISKIPCDVTYIGKAFYAAKQKLQSLLLPHEVFENKLELSWQMARQFSKSDETVLILDVAKMYLVAAQEDRFWASPKKQYFVDYPNASFIINFLQWKANAVSSSEARFEITPATVHQAHGNTAKVFFLPLNLEGTQTRPYMYMNKRF